MIYISHLIKDQEMKKLIEQTNVGCESIEFSIGFNLDRLEQKLEEYKERLHQMGAEELILHGPFLDLNPASYDSKIRKATRERMEQAWEAAKYLNAKKIVFHNGFVPAIYYREGWAQQAADFWNEYMEGKEGIQILLENVLDPIPELLLDIKKSVPHPEFRLCLDIGHANCYSKVEIEKWIDLLGEFLGHVHIHDNDSTRDQHWGMGRGTIAWESVLKQLKEKTTDLTYTIECNTTEEILESIRMLQK